MKRSIGIGGHKRPPRMRKWLVWVLTPAPAFGSKLPPEGHVQLLDRLRGAPVEVRPLMKVESVAAATVTARNVLSGAVADFAADVLVVVGERRPLEWEELVPPGPGVQVIGDAVVPRRVQHAISEGRAAASLPDVAASCSCVSR